MFLQVGPLFENMQEDLFVHFRVVFVFLLELDSFDDVEVSAEEHEPIDVEFIKGLGHLIKDDSFRKLVLAIAAAVMVKDDAKLMVVHMYYFQWFFNDGLLFFQ